MHAIEDQAGLLHELENVGKYQFRPRVINLLTTLCEMRRHCATMRRLQPHVMADLSSNYRCTRIFTHWRARGRWLVPRGMPEVGEDEKSGKKEASPATCFGLSGRVRIHNSPARHRVNVCAQTPPTQSLPTQKLVWPHPGSSRCTPL
jgi:hypothetical protein